jgi:alcohol dehydrogenase (cytochrome c)
MIAINITNGRIIWATPFVARGTVLNVKAPDTHDWATSWGSSVSKVTFDNGTQKKIVIGHDKMGNIIAMNAATGKEIWWKILGKQHNTDAIPNPSGSGMIWSYGIFNYHAVDNNNTLYIAATNRGLNYFTDSGVAGHREAASTYHRTRIAKWDNSCNGFKHWDCICWLYPFYRKDKRESYINNKKWHDISVG